MKAGLFYAEWDIPPDHREAMLNVILDHGSPTYRQAVRAFWHLGHYTLSAEVEVQAETPTAALETIWAWFNRGSGEEHRLLNDNRLRSLSVGDVVCLDTAFYVCRSQGWEAINLEDA